MSRIKPSVIKNPDTIDDNFLSSQGYGIAFENLSDSLEDTLNSIITQVRRITGETNWYDDPDTNLSAIAAGGITGSGTINIVPKFTGSGSIGDSQLTDDGTDFTSSATDNFFTGNIGIGSSVDPPESKLYISDNTLPTGVISVPGGGSFPSPMKFYAVEKKTVADGAISLTGSTLHWQTIADSTTSTAFSGTNFLNNSSGTIGGIQIGITGQVEVQTSGTVNLTEAVNATVWITGGSGTIDESIGVLGSISHTSPGLSTTVTEAKALVANITGFFTSTPIADTAYGLYVDNINGATDSWGIYVLGSSAGSTLAADKNFIGNPLKILDGAYDDPVTTPGSDDPHASAILELASDSKGFLPPRTTGTLRDAIASPATGLQIYNTDTNYIDYYNGSSWISLANISADLTGNEFVIGNGSSLSSFSLGTANQIIGVNAGATANEYKTLSGTSNQITISHGVGTITFSTPQDIATTSTPVFGGMTLNGNLDLNSNNIVDVANPTSAQHAATKSYVDSLIQGLDWQESVLDRDLATPPGGPTTGDRYIVAATATGAWVGQEEKIAEWNGSSWDFITPDEGTAVFVEDEDVLVVYSSAHPAGTWVLFGSNLDHGALNGLLDDDHTQYALLAGRSTGQTLRGGTASGENLTLESTSNATKGDVVIIGDLVPNSNDTYSLGLDAQRWADLFVSGGSIHIGSSGDDATVGYDETNNKVDINRHTRVSNNVTGSQSFVYGFSGGIDNVGSGTMTDVYDFYSVIENSGSGANTNAYAFFGESISATNPFGIAIVDSNASNYFAGQVGIGIDSVNNSSALEISSTTQGFLPPRMTEAERDAISTPAQGLMVFNTNTGTIDVWDGAMWDTTSTHDPVTLAGTPDYLTLSNQEITLGLIDLTTDVTGTLPVGNGGTGATTFTSSAFLVGNGTSAVSSFALGTANQIIGMNSGATANEYKTLSGTSNQISVSHGAGTVTLSTPQDIGASSSPTFGGLTLNGSLLPGLDDTYSIGSDSLRWADLFVSGGSIHIGTSGDEAIVGYDTFGNKVDIDKHTKVNNNVTGTISDTYGFSAKVDNVGSGTITRMYDFYSAIDNSGAGSVTNGYAFFGESINATNPFGVAIADSNAVNYFAGDVGIGKTDPFVDFVSASGDIPSSSGLHIKDSLGVASVALEGETGARVVWGEPNGTAGERIIEAYLNSDFFRFRTLEDDFTTIDTDNILGISMVNHTVLVGGTTDSFNLNGAFDVYPALFVTNNDAQGGALGAVSFSDTSNLDAAFFGVRARGTESSPSALVDGDETFTISSVGYDGANYVQNAAMVFGIDGTPSSNNMPGYINFSVNVGGPFASGLFRMDKNSNFKIGDTNDSLVDFVSASGDFASTNKGIHIDQDSGSDKAVIAMEGAGGSGIFLGDRGGTSNTRIMEINQDANVFTIRSINDDLTTNVDQILELDNSSGDVLIGGGNLEVSNSILRVDAGADAPIIITPKGDGAFQLDSGGNTRGIEAVELQRTRTASTAVASGDYSSVVGGSENTASGNHSVAMGTFANARNEGQLAHANSNTGLSHQYTRIILRRDTTDASSTELTADGAAPAAGTRLTIPADTTVGFKANIIARQDSGTNSARFERDGLIQNTGGTTALVGAVANTLDINSTAWSVSIAADDTNDSLQINVTGAGSTNISWVAIVETYEIYNA